MRHLLLPLLVCWPLVGLANESLKPFDVSYLYSSGLRSAEVRVSLQSEDEQWLWRTEVSPGSFLALFSNERLFTNTRFSLHNNQPRIAQIELGSDSDNQPRELADFDWSEKRMESLRKGKKNRLLLMNPVYDSNTIHLLALDLYFSAESTRQVDFYHKGKLTTVSLKYRGLKQINQDGGLARAELFSLQREGSDSLVLYYYEPGEMLYPLRIEHQNPGETPVIMTLQKAQS